MEDLQKQIIAVQLIQELIVDKLDAAGVFSRGEFEEELKVRADELNDTLRKISEEMIEEQSKKIIMFGNNIIGEA